MPLPRCADLAERLRLQCRDCIEPQVSLLEVGAVPIEDDGSGVIVIRVPKSRMAPHRHSATKECYIRRADRSEKMTMREIQDLTLQVERGLAAIDAAFDTRFSLFVERLRNFKGGGASAELRELQVSNMVLRLELVTLGASCLLAVTPDAPK